MATTRKPRAAKTSADLKAQLELAKKKLEELEKRAYAEELTEAIKSTNIVSEFSKLKAKVNKVSDTAILEATATAVGLKRITVTQAEPAKRKSSGKPRKSTKSA